MSSEKALTLKDLIEYCQRSYELNKPITIFFKLPDTPLPETITNPVQNIPAKIEYYKGVYGDDLRHKYSDVRIIGFLDNTKNVQKGVLH